MFWKKFTIFTERIVQYSPKDMYNVSLKKCKIYSERHVQYLLKCNMFTERNVHYLLKTSCLKELYNKS